MTPDWKERVRAELGKKRGRHAELARHLGISSQSLATLLGDEQQTTPYVPEIHEFLGWAPPVAPVASRDVPEIRHILRRLSRRDQQRLAQLLESKTDDETRALIEAFITLAGAGNSGPR